MSPLGISRTRYRRLAALAAAACLTTASPVLADTKTDLSAATKRAQALEKSITSKEAEVSAASTKLKAMSAQVEQRRGDANVVSRQLDQTRVQLERKEQEYRDLRAQLGRRARAVYVRGPGYGFEPFLGITSLRDLAARLTFSSRVFRRDTDLALKTERTAAQLDSQRASEQQLLSQKAGLLKEARDEQSVLAGAFVKQQRGLADLARSRAELTTLIGQLASKLKAEELARLKRVAGKGMPITFGQWADSFLRTAGAPVVRSNLVAVVAWETAEYTQATWNPLATTYAMPDATTYNSSGVRNYVSKEQGIEAVMLTLGRPRHGYESILSSLRAGGASMSTAQAINASDWCRGCAGGSYVTGFIPAVEQYYERYAN